MPRQSSPAATYARAVRTLSRPSPAHLAKLAEHEARDQKLRAEVDAIYAAGGMDAIRAAYAAHEATRGTAEHDSRYAFGGAMVGYLRGRLPLAGA